MPDHSFSFESSCDQHRRRIMSAAGKRFLPYTPKRERNYRSKKIIEPACTSQEKPYDRSMKLKKFYDCGMDSTLSPSSSTHHQHHRGSGGDKYRRSRRHHHQQHHNETNDRSDYNRPKGDVLPPEKCSLVLARCYNINKSGSKKVIIGLDVENEFQTTVFIAKNGNAGIYFNQNVWHHFIYQLSDSLSACFESEVDTVMDKMAIAENVKAEFMDLYGEKILKLVKGEQYSVLLGRESWFGLLNLKKCIEDALDQCNLWNDHVCDIIAEATAGIKRYLASNCNSCINDYVSDSHECSNLEFIEKYINEYLEENTKNIHDIGDACDVQLPRDRLLYELKMYYPEILLQSLSK